MPADRHVGIGLRQPHYEALVWRQGWRVQVAVLGVANARFTRRVLQGQALGAALQATAAEAATGTATEPGFDFQRWLLLQLQRGWLAGVGPAGGQRYCAAQLEIALIAQRLRGTEQGFARRGWRHATAICCRSLASAV